MVVQDVAALQPAQNLQGVDQTVAANAKEDIIGFDDHRNVVGLPGDLWILRRNVGHTGYSLFQREARVV